MKIVEVSIFSTVEIGTPVSFYLRFIPSRLGDTVAAAVSDYCTGENGDNLSDGDGNAGLYSRRIRFTIFNLFLSTLYTKVERIKSQG